MPRTLTLAKLQRLILKRHGEIAELLDRRRELVRAFRGRGRKTLRGLGRRRPRNDQTIGEILASTLKRRRRAMTPTELTEALAASGYKSRAKNLRVVVYQALRDNKRIIGNGRGLYRLKRAG